MPKKPGRRGWGAGSITWLTPSKVLLRISTDEGVKSKTVRVAHRDHGGRGEADAALAAFAASLEDEKVAPSSETLGTVLAYYVEHCERIGRRRGTVETYQDIAKRIPAELSGRPIDTLTADDFDQLYGAMKAKGLAEKTIRTTHAVLRAALRQAAWSGRIPTNPSERATPPANPKGTKSRITPAEVWAMIEAATKAKSEGGDEDPVLAMAMFLSTYAGCRRGELCGLRWDDLDEVTCRLSIQRQWVPGKGGQYLEDLKSATGTTEGARIVKLAPVVVDAVLRYRAWQGRALNRAPEGWLLSHDGGTTPMRAKSLGTAITELGKRTGINATTHSFRRTSSTELVASGVDVDTAARRQGQTKDVMFADYLLGADDKADAAAVLLADRLIDRGLPIGELFGGESAV